MMTDKKNCAKFIKYKKIASAYIWGPIWVWAPGQCLPAPHIQPEPAEDVVAYSKQNQNDSSTIRGYQKEPSSSSIAE